MSNRHYGCTPLEGATNLCTYLDQSQSSIRYYGPSPREGAVNLYTDSDQSKSRSSIHYHERSPREGAVNLSTDMNQSEPKILLKVHPPREGADCLCTIIDQSELERRIHCSGKILNHSIASCNKTQFPSVSNCTISKPSVPFCKYNTVISGSPSSKNLSIKDMSNATDDLIMEESFRSC